jgi:hypothetical protein
MGLFVAAVVFFRDSFPSLEHAAAGWLAIVVFVFLVVYLTRIPLSKAGAADEPAPPTAVM